MQKSNSIEYMDWEKNPKYGEKNKLCDYFQMILQKHTSSLEMY